MFKKVLIGIILFGLIAILLLQIDDDLNPDVITLLEKTKPAESSDAYLYLLGIVAAEGEEPLAVGKQLFALMQQAEQSHAVGEDTFGYEGYAENKKITLPSGALFCNSWQKGCWQIMFDNKQLRTQELATHAVLLQRYQIFIEMTDYRTLSKPTATEVFPPFQYLVKANRLVILSAINTAQTESPSEAVTLLKGHITVLRQHLKSADNLIGKMVYTTLISDNLDALSLIIHQNNLVFEDQIKPISLAVRDLEIVMAREFALIYDLYTSMDKHPDFFASDDDDGFNNDGGFKAPGWAARTIFKPNMSINEAYLFYERIVARSQLDQIEFTPTTDKASTSFRFRLSYIRNSVGAILNDIAKPNFDQYIAQLFDLNAKIALFNQTASQAELPDDLNFIQNPYYETGGTAFYSEDGKRICLTAPLADDKKLRCLKLTL